MNQLPQVCKDCAEYGSDFCKDCLDELNQNLSAEDRVHLSQALQNIAASLANAKIETLGSTDSENS